MTTIISGSSPSITFSDSTTQTTAFTSTPSVTSITTSADASIHGLTVGLGAGAVSTNTAVGVSALAANTSGDRSVAIGGNALVANTSGVRNVAVGYNSIATNTTGSYNVGLGEDALNANTTGANNVGVGYLALYQNTTASNNTAVGYQAGYSNTTGAGNIFIGYQSGYTSNRSDGNAYNVCVGWQAGYALTSGNGNTFVGSATGPGGSGALVTTGSKNSILGSYSGNQGGLDIRTASNYIVLSDGDGNPRGVFDGSGRFLVGTAAYVHNSISITSVNANDAQYVTRNSTTTSGNNWRFGADSSNSYQIVNQSAVGVKVTDGATSWSSVSDERLKDIIEPITDASNKVSTLRAVIGKYKTDEEGTRRSFLIAQDVQAVFPEAIDSSNLDELSLRYSEVIPLLVAAFKELNTLVTAQAAEITALKAKVGI